MSAEQRARLRSRAAAQWHQARPRTLSHLLSVGLRLADEKCSVSLGYAPVQVLNRSPLDPRTLGFVAQYSAAVMVTNKDAQQQAQRMRSIRAARG